VTVTVTVTVTVPAFEEILWFMVTVTVAGYLF
jgi:hypothetical protein